MYMKYIIDTVLPDDLDQLPPSNIRNALYTVTLTIVNGAEACNKALIVCNNSID